MQPLPAQQPLHWLTAEWPADILEEALPSLEAPVLGAALEPQSAMPPPA